MAKALYAQSGQPFLCAQGGYLIAGTDTAEPDCVCGGTPLCCPQPFNVRPIASTRIAVHNGTFTLRSESIAGFTQSDYTFDFDVALPLGSAVQSPCSYAQEYRTPYLVIGNIHTFDSGGLNTNSPFFLGSSPDGGPAQRSILTIETGRITMEVVRLGGDLSFITADGSTLTSHAFGSVAISGTTVTLTVVGSDSRTQGGGVTITRTYNFTAVYSGLVQCATPAPPPTINIGGIEYPPGWVLNSDGVPIPPSHNCNGCGQ